MGQENGRIELTARMDLSWADFDLRCQELASRIQKHQLGIHGIYGIPSGGWHVARKLSELLNLPVVNEPTFTTLIVDDLIDTGRTAERYREIGPVYALYHKPWTPEHLRRDSICVRDWVRFPWEGETGAEDIVVRLLQFVGEDPTREGLVDTPKRVLKAFKEMTSGYAESPKEILSTVFSERCDELVLLKDIRFHSLCEHHLLPFSGRAHVGYIPKHSVVGLSKLARLVFCFAKRLQVQERLTREIAFAIEEVLSPLGVAVVIEAAHQCMACRGVKVQGSEMVTSAMLGAFREQASARAEFLALIGTKRS